MGKQSGVNSKRSLGIEITAFNQHLIVAAPTQLEMIRSAEMFCRYGLGEMILLAGCFRIFPFSGTSQSLGCFDGGRTFRDPWRSPKLRIFRSTPNLINDSFVFGVVLEGGGVCVLVYCKLGGFRLLDRGSSGSCRIRGQKKSPTSSLDEIGLITGDDLLSQDLSSHYHRRCSVSLPGSEWDRVVPLRSGHQNSNFAGLPY